LIEGKYLVRWLVEGRSVKGEFSGVESLENAKSLREEG